MRLIDSLPSVLALLGDGLEPGYYRHQDLHHDGRGDVRIDPQRGHAEVCQGAAAEQVQETQQSLLLKSLGQRLRVTPGTGTWATNRKITSMPSVKRIFWRRSGTRMASSMDWMSCGRETCCVLVACADASVDHPHLSSDGLDLFPGRTRELVGLDNQGDL